MLLIPRRYYKKGAQQYGFHGFLIVSYGMNYIAGPEATQQMVK